MCILFVFVDNSPRTDGYQVIIANNRDEYFNRPSKPAEKWKEGGSMISGRDMTTGKEGGTWLGMSTTGKFASLLNISQPQIDPTKKGRGFLVVDYLRNDIDAKTYVEPISQEGDQYNGYSLVMLERKNGAWEVVYYSNKEPTSPYVIDTNISGFGNSIHKKPWNKVVRGNSEFEDIIKKLNSFQTKEQLQASLVDFLNDTTPTLPDPALQSREHLTKYLKELSCRNVKIPQNNYGTRTNTVILIDAEGNGEYLERNMTDPIQPEEPNWETKKIPFTLE